MPQIHVADQGQGKVICEINTIDLEKLNSSALGPISVDRITGEKLMITFKQQFSFLYLGYQLEKEFVLAKSQFNCTGLIHLGSTTNIIVIGNDYHFRE